MDFSFLRKRKMICQYNEGTAHKKILLSNQHQRDLEQLKYLTISQLLKCSVTKLKNNASLTLEVLFSKKEIHNEIFKRLNKFIEYMIINEGANWNLVSQRS